MSQIRKIREEAKAHKGMQFSAADFRYSFGFQMTGSMQLLNELIAEGTIKVVGEYANGSKKYEVA